jgi:hypothetical protein
MAYAFRPMPAIDQSGELVTSGSGQVYAAATGGSPLTVRNEAGVSITDIPVSSLGMTSYFEHDTIPEMYWRSGDFVVHVASVTGMRLAADAAAASAAAAQAVAAVLAAGVVRSVNGQTPDGTGSVIITTGGGTGGTTDHNALSNLTTGDPHTQYLNVARGNAAYYTKAQVDAFVAAAATSASAADRNRANHTGVQGIASVTNLQASLDTRAYTVTVATGNETRPTHSGTVIWISPLGIDPVNALSTDIVLLTSGSGGGSDTTAPTTPTGLNHSGLSSTGFSLAWTASGDNVGVTGYDVRVNGAILASPTSPSATLSGLTPSTAYVVAVRAKDAAGNVSPYGSSITVTTDAASGTPQHSIFGATAYGGRSVAVFTDGTPSIQLATAFYRTGAGTAGWRLRGGRLWIPSGASLPSSVTMFVYTPGSATNPDLSTAPAQTKVVAVSGSGVWLEGLFDTPIATTAGIPVFIGYQFASTGIYIATSGSPGAGPVSATDGSAIHEASTTEGTFSRAIFRIGSGATITPATPNTYSIDAIWDEGA